MSKFDLFNDDEIKLNPVIVIKSNNVKDNTAEIQAAVNEASETGATIHFEPGTFFICNNFIIPHIS